jgi:hypothetical protein
MAEQIEAETGRLFLRQNGRPYPVEIYGRVGFGSLQ